MKKIAHTKPYLDDDHRSSLLRQFESRLINQSSLGNVLLETLAAKFDHAGGMLQATGTHALALGIKTLAERNKYPSPRVLISDYSCPCIIEAVYIANGQPILCDADPDHLSLNVESVLRIVEKEEVDIIILPHMFGLPADVKPIKEIGIPIIEDCAHSPGALYQGQKIGSFAELTIYSFEGSKMLPAGEGGAVMANCNAMVDQLKKTAGQMKSFHKHSRMSDLIASLALVQIEEYDSIVRQRKEIALKYSAALSDLYNKKRVRLPVKFEDREHIYYRYIIQVSPMEAQNLIESAQNAGILFKQPINTGPLSKLYHDERELFLGSKAIHSSSVSIPVYPDLKDEEFNRIVQFLNEYEWRERYAPTKF